MLMPPLSSAVIRKDMIISLDVYIQMMFHLSQGDVWKITDHPDQSNYPGQKLYFVIVDSYVYIVPYTVENEYIFLKTIIPSRKATKMYKEERES